jgi:hypothetical protein
MGPKRADAFDETGQLLRRGDIVVVKRLPDGLLRGLPDNDQTAIRKCVGLTFAIVDFNPLDEAEIEFKDESNDFHTIWIATNCLEKTKPI